MGIFSFLKKFGKEKEIEEIIMEKLALSEIEGWIEGKIRENEPKEKKILLVIMDKIKDFIKDLEEKIVILEDFDVEARKDKDRIKNVVTDSRKEYIKSIEDLIEKLNNLKELRLEKFIEKINKIFFDFNKASFKNYERANILIGKEMANIKEVFRTFSKDLLEIFSNNKEISELFKKIELIKSKLNLLDPIEKSMIGVNGEITSINEEINQKLKENLILLDEIERIKQSESYKNMLEQKEKISALKEESKDNILALKQLIDFKALANFFHIFPKQMGILKDYKEDFHSNFEKDNGQRIVNLLDESKLNSDEIVEKLKNISSKLEEIKKDEQEIKKDETQELNHKIRETTIKVDYLKIGKIRDEKRDEKLGLNKEELINSLKQELSKMNVEMV